MMLVRATEKIFLPVCGMYNNAVLVLPTVSSLVIISAVDLQPAVHWCV